MADMDSHNYEYLAEDVDYPYLQDLEELERVERRFPYIPINRKNDMEYLDDVDFRSRYRLQKKTVEEIVTMLSPKLRSQTSRNSAITPTEKILAALRFFASGGLQINMGDIQQMSQPSISRAVADVATCVAELAPDYICLPQTEEERLAISESFFSRFGFPSVYGALDCTLIEVISPGGLYAETFRCRKGWFALNVQTMSDADLVIRNLVVRWPGSTHDSRIFDNSFLRAHLETSVPTRYHVLGDNGYPLRDYLLTPFLRPSNASQRRYNAAQILARNVVERQYGVWKSRFRCISVPLRCSLKNAQSIIVATAVLHNVAIFAGDFYDEDISSSIHSNTHLNRSGSTSGIAKRNSIVSSFF